MPKLCPLLCAAVLTKSDANGLIGREVEMCWCGESNCAWWSPYEQCEVRSIAGSLADIQNELNRRNQYL